MRDRELSSTLRISNFAIHSGPSARFADAASLSVRRRGATRRAALILASMESGFSPATGGPLATLSSRAEGTDQVSTTAREVRKRQIALPGAPVVSRDHRDIIDKLRP